MPPFQRLCAASLLLLSASQILAEDKPLDQTVGMRVALDAGGRVLSVQPTDKKALDFLNRIGEETARKLSFAPARKNGVAAPSESTLYLTFGFERREGGQVGLRLKKATNGPGVAELAPVVPPKYQQGADRGATIVVGVSLRADGTPDMATFRTESVAMRVESKFGEARYIDAIKASLRNSRFTPDKVDGESVPTHVSIPYQFGGGGERRDDDVRARRRSEERSNESDAALDWHAVSEQAGVELPRVQFTAPPEAGKQ